MTYVPHDGALSSPPHPNSFLGGSRNDLQFPSNYVSLWVLDFMLGFFVVVFTTFFPLLKSLSPELRILFRKVLKSSFNVF